MTGSVFGKPIVLLGAGGHGRVALDVCCAAGLPVVGFLDQSVRDLVNGIPILGGDALLSNRGFVTAHRFLPALGIQGIRRRLSEAILAVGGELVSAIHPTVCLSPSVKIGEGTLVVAGGILNSGACVGRFCIINTRASVDHDCILEDGAQIGPGAILCGAVRCGADAVVGAGAVVLPGRRVGEHAVVGAGAVVTHDVADGVTVVGNPARPR